MKTWVTYLSLIPAAALAACVATPEPKTEPKSADTLTLAEAKKAACPESVLDAGASPQDCSCVEKRLYEIGKKPGAIKYDPSAVLEQTAGAETKRDVAIGILRLDAFEHCGLFHPDHPVAKNL